MLANVPSISADEEDCDWVDGFWCTLPSLRALVVGEVIQRVHCCDWWNPPMNITLCEQKDFLGECITQSVPKDKCVRVTKSDWASSVNTSRKCFRLYENEDCTGKSIAFQPDSMSPEDLEKVGMDKIISSVSWCFTSDLCVTHTKTGSMYKSGCQWANHVLRIGEITWLPIDTSNLEGSPVLWYQTGRWSNRTDVMHAHVHKHHLRYAVLRPISVEALMYGRHIGYPDDGVDRILPRFLGGSSNDYRNIFPRSRNFDGDHWTRVEDRVEQHVLTYGSAYLTINLAYHTPFESRPFLIIYRIRPGDLSSDDIIINDIVNPNP